MLIVTKCKTEEVHERLTKNAERKYFQACCTLMEECSLADVFQKKWLAYQGDDYISDC